MILLQESDPSFYTLVKQRDFQCVDPSSLYPWPLFSFANFSKRRLSQAQFFIKFEDKNRLLLIFTSVSRGHPVSSTLSQRVSTTYVKLKCDVCPAGFQHEQGRIHDYLCRGRLGRGSNELGRGSIDLGMGINIHEMLISELFYLQIAQICEKSKV